MQSRDAICWRCQGRGGFRGPSGWRKCKCKTAPTPQAQAAHQQQALFDMAHDPPRLQRALDNGSPLAKQIVTRAKFTGRCPCGNAIQLNMLIAKNDEGDWMHYYCRYPENVPNGW